MKLAVGPHRFSTGHKCQGRTTEVGSLRVREAQKEDRATGFRGELACLKALTRETKQRRQRPKTAGPTKPDWAQPPLLLPARRATSIAFHGPSCFRLASARSAAQPSPMLGCKQHSPLLKPPGNVRIGSASPALSHLLHKPVGTSTFNSLGSSGANIRHLLPGTESGQIPTFLLK